MIRLIERSTRRGFAKTLIRSYQTTVLIENLLLSTLVEGTEVFSRWREVR
jgi:hypothetical protein